MNPPAQTQAAAPAPKKREWLDAWHVNPSLNRDYDCIDGLRGLAILMVLAGHHFYINPNAGPDEKFVGAVIGTGGYGVTLFFALSGFLISWPFWKRKVDKSAQAVPPGYGWRRFWKIYPPLALSVVIFTAFDISQTRDWSYVSVAAQWLTGLTMFLPVSGKLNPVMWSLVIEMQFYATLPLVFLLLRRVSIKATLGAVTLIFLAAPVLIRVLTGTAPEFFPVINSHYPSALDAFYLGIMMAAFDRMGVLKKSHAWIGDLGLVLLGVSVLLTAWVNLHYPGAGPVRTDGLGWLVKISAGCLLCYTTNPQHPRARLFSMPWLRWCGIISYEWYLFHQPLVLWARNTFGPAAGYVPKYLAITVGSLLVSMVVSALIYRYFSLPILKYGRSNK